MPTFLPNHRVLQVLAVAAICLSVTARGAEARAAEAQAAQRPDATRLLPENTLLFIRLPDAVETVSLFQETALGRISQDPAMKPLISQLYGAATEALRNMEDEIGVSLDDLLSIPQGEACFALVDWPEAGVTPVFVVDAGAKLPVAERWLERVGGKLVAEGATRKDETVGDTRITVYGPLGSAPGMAFVVRNGVVLATQYVDLAKGMLAAWDGANGARRSLADNAKFAGVMRRCVATDSRPPQVEFFVDPIGLFAAASRDSLGAQTALALFPALGLNGIRGLGGNLTFATDDFDVLTHLHLLLDSPRKGALELVALQHGETQPEAWVSADTVSYATVNWDFAKTYAKFAELYDSVRGPGALAESFEQDMQGRLNVDFQKDLIGAAAGRVTLASAMVRPARLNSRASVLGIKLKDPAAFAKTLETLVGNIRPPLARESFGGISYYRLPPREPPAKPRRGLPMRQPDPATAIVDDYLLISDSTDLLKQAIATRNGGAEPLADQLEFRLIASKIRRQAGGDRAGLIAFDRPEETLRLWYDVVTADTTRQRISQRAERSPLLRSVDAALQNHPLPPFAVLARYLAPSGSLLTDDESGLHYVGFTLRRK